LNKAQEKSEEASRFVATQTKLRHQIANEKSAARWEEKKGGKIKNGTTAEPKTSNSVMIAEIKTSEQKIGEDLGSELIFSFIFL
jgi:hypothetical protein